MRAYSPARLCAASIGRPVRASRDCGGVFESTTDLKVALFLAIESFEAMARQELGISTVASLAAYLIERDHQTGLWVNFVVGGLGMPAGSSRLRRKSN